jgi:hypothetical protein
MKKALLLTLFFVATSVFSPNGNSETLSAEETLSVTQLLRTLYPGTGDYLITEIKVSDEDAMISSLALEGTMYNEDGSNDADTFKFSIKKVDNQIRFNGSIEVERNDLERVESLEEYVGGLAVLALRVNHKNGDDGPLRAYMEYGQNENGDFSRFVLTPRAEGQSVLTHFSLSAELNGDDLTINTEGIVEANHQQIRVLRMASTLVLRNLREGSAPNQSDFETIARVFGSLEENIAHIAGGDLF